MAAKGKKVKSLENKPELDDLETVYHNAFKRLLGSRGGFGGPIPLSEIYAYSKMFGFYSFESRADLFRFVSVCDSAWLMAKKGQESGGDTGKRS